MEAKAPVKTKNSTVAVLEAYTVVDTVNKLKAEALV